MDPASAQFTWPACSRSGWWRKIHYWVAPDARQRVPDGFMERFSALAERGAVYLRNIDFVCTPSYGILYMYMRQSRFMLRVRVANLDPLLQCMAELTALLEQISPRPALAPTPPGEGANLFGQQ
jgi:hypothetical protein